MEIFIFGYSDWLREVALVSNSVVRSMQKSLNIIRNPDSRKRGSCGHWRCINMHSGILFRRIYRAPDPCICGFHISKKVLIIAAVQ